MKRLQPVIWSKGTALAPQHLQSQDRYFENSLQFRLNALAFRPWGFKHLTIDQELLASGSFAVSQASGLLPDGLPFDIPDSDDPPAAKPLDKVFEPDTDVVDLYLAIPEHKERGLNISATPESSSRYYAEATFLRDETTGMSERPVRMAKKNFRLLTGSELREGYSSLPVARVKRSAAGAYSADAAFVPPLLNIHASPPLVSMVRRLVEILAAKSGRLADQRRHKSRVLAEFTASDIPNFWLLYTINSYLPRLNHLYEGKRSHPEPLFYAMLGLAGALTTFSKEVDVRDLPKYDHDDLSGCFHDLESKLRILLETTVPSNFVALALKQIQPFIYGTALDDEKYLTNTHLYLAIQAEVNQADLIGKVPQLVKICSANHIEHLIRHALPGVPLTYVPSPPGSIPVKLNYKYYSLSQTGLAWEAVTRSRNLAAYVPEDFPHPQLELVILLPEKSEL
jgi:type VI secretion system protein ImpJ